MGKSLNRGSRGRSLNSVSPRGRSAPAAAPRRPYPPVRYAGCRAHSAAPAQVALVVARDEHVGDVAAAAASSFSVRPPMGSTRSAEGDPPVMARLRSTGSLRMASDGGGDGDARGRPVLGNGTSGTCTWISIFRRNRCPAPGAGPASARRTGPRGRIPASRRRVMGDGQLARARQDRGLDLQQFATHSSVQAMPVARPTSRSSAKPKRCTWPAW